MSKNLPLYIIENAHQKKLLKQKAAEILFPLTEEEEQLIDTMKYMVKEGLEGGAAGLAAPQVGVLKRIIVYHVLAEWGKWRRDLEAEPLTVLINPFYRPLSESEQELEWEGCFSVRDLIGKVYRYKTIEYAGYDEKGRPVKGVAKGFLSRLLQHEIDHVNGTLMVDRLDLSSPHGSPKEMQKILEEEVGEIGLDFI